MPNNTSYKNVLVVQSLAFLCGVFCGSLFVLVPMVVILSVSLLTTSDYPFDNFSYDIIQTSNI